ncbi:MAG: tetratricopeptide repeat protein [Candidatus Acidiferrales bacterium]
MKLPKAIPGGILLLTLFLGLGLPLAAQDFGAIEGEVRDADGRPMPGITIEIIRSDQKGRWEVKTDSKGHYMYMGIPGGNRPKYTIRALRGTELLYEFTNVMIEMQTVRRQDFNLKQLRKEDEERITPEQKREIEEQRKQMEKMKGLTAEFDLGVKFLQAPTSELVCSTRCANQTENNAACLESCQQQASAGLSQMAYEEAAAAFERASAIDPTQYAVYANMARAYQASNQTDKAIAANLKAVELKPEDGGLYANLSLLYVRTGRKDEARQMVDKGAQLNPLQAAKYYFDLGAALYNANDLKAALEPFRKTTEFDPKRAEAFFYLGMCLYNQAEFKQEGGQWVTVLRPGTREAFDQYLALDPDGRFAKDAKDTLVALEATVPAAVRVKKKP